MTWSVSKIKVVLFYCMDARWVAMPGAYQGLQREYIFFFDNDNALLFIYITS